MSKKKIVMLLTREPYPIDNGRKSIIAQTIEFLKDSYQIKLLIFSKYEIDKQRYFDKGIADVEKLYYPSKSELIKNIIVESRISLQERLFLSKKSLKIVQNTIVSFKPDIIYADMIRTAQYLEKINYDKKKVVDIDDLLSIRYSRFLDSKESSIFGTFENLLPVIIRKPIEKLLKNLILKKEINLIQKREIEIAKKFDIAFLVSKKESQHLSDTVGKKVYTNTQAIKSRVNLYQYPNENNFIFIGNMATAQNLASLKMIVENILPLFDFKYKLFVVGNYDEKTENLAKENSNIELLGFVDNLENILKKTKLALMPISFGTGIKTKILDCMSYGIPVLTNSVGNEGLSTKNLKDIMLFENDEITSDKIIEILEDKQLLKKISQNGHEYIIENHDFYKLKEQFLKTIKEN